MVTRMTFTQADVAVQVANAIDQAGYEVALITERADGQESYLVATPEPAERIAPLVPAGTPLVDEPIGPADSPAGPSRENQLPSEDGETSTSE